MITLEKKKYIKKELIILTVSMIILISIIYFCYVLLTNKYGDKTIWVSIKHYFEIGDIVGLISLVYFITLAFAFVLNNYKIFVRKRKTTLSLIIFIPIFLTILEANIQAVIVHPYQPINIPWYYLDVSFSYLVSLILYLIPTYYFRFKYYSHPKNNDELELVNSTLSLRPE